MRARARRCCAQAAASASTLLSQVAAELEDSDLADLIAQAGLLGKAGGAAGTPGGKEGADGGAALLAGLDESLVRDLQIIQNLMGALKGGGGGGAPGAASVGGGGSAGGGSRGSASSPLVARGAGAGLGVPAAALGSSP